MNSNTNLANYINRMDEKQQVMLELFLHTMQKEYVLSAMHGSHTPTDFDPELVSKLSRILENMHVGQIEKVRNKIY